MKLVKLEQDPRKILNARLETIKRKREEHIATFLEFYYMIHMNPTPSVRLARADAEQHFSEEEKNRWKLDKILKTINETWDHEIMKAVEDYQREVEK